MFRFLIMGVLFRVAWVTITFFASLVHSLIARVVGAHATLFGNLFATEPDPSQRRTTRRL